MLWAWPSSLGQVTCFSCLHSPICQGAQGLLSTWDVQTPGRGSAAFLAKVRPTVRQRGSGQRRTQAAASPSSLGGPSAYLGQGKAGVGEEEILLQRSDSVRG